MSEFNITRDNAAKGLAAIAAFDLSNARSAAVSTLASAAKELEAIQTRRAKIDARVREKLKELADKRDRQTHILGNPDSNTDYPNDQAALNAAAAMDGETAELRRLAAAHKAYLRELFAELGAERAFVESLIAGREGLS